MTSRVCEWCGNGSGMQAVSHRGGTVLLCQWCQPRELFAVRYRADLEAREAAALREERSYWGACLVGSLVWLAFVLVSGWWVWVR